MHWAETFTQSDLRYGHMWQIFVGQKNVNCLLPISVVMYEAQHRQNSFLNRAVNLLDQTEPIAKSEIFRSVDIYIETSGSHL